MKNHFLITFSRVAELGGKVVYSVPPSREFRAQTVPPGYESSDIDSWTLLFYVSRLSVEDKSSTGSPTVNLESCNNQQKKSSVNG